MWAAYYAQYSQAQQMGANGAVDGTAAAAAAAAGTGTAAGAAQNEAAYEQWIEYYKAYGMVNEAEAMEKSLVEFRKSKKVSQDCFKHRLFVVTNVLLSQQGGEDNGKQHESSKNQSRDHESSHHHRSRRNGDHSD